MQFSKKNGAQLPKVIYIMGTARSGSTILSLLLGTDKKVCIAGELTNIDKDGFIANKECSCGRHTEDCNFWGEIKNSLNSGHRNFKDAAKINKAVDWHDGFLKQVFSIIGKKRKKNYKENTLKLFSALKKGSECPVIVDSSKYAGRAMAIERFAGVEVWVICLTRSPSGLLHSFQKPNKVEQTPKTPLSVLLYYWITLVSFRTVSFFLKNKIFYLSYEQLLEEPISTLKKIEGWSGIDLKESIRKVNKHEAFEVGHLVTANRLRKQKRVKFDPNLSPSRKLSPLNSGVVKIMTVYGRCLGFINKQR